MTTCPDGVERDELELFLCEAAELSRDRAAFLDSHLGHCPTCDEVAQALTSEAGGLPLRLVAGRARTHEADAPPEVDGYRNLTLAGKGGMGCVWKAEQISPSRTVALKMLKVGTFAMTANLARFQAEVQTLARLSHPHIVSLLEVGRTEQGPYFTMEFIEGDTLAKRLGKTGPWPWKDAAVLVEALARAVHYAHQEGVVHRDIKPGNVLFAHDDFPKVSDFGLAQCLEGPVGEAASLVGGTPAYMAPEQIVPQKWGNVTPRTDVWALGATLYEILTGHPPFPSATTRGILDRILSDDPSPPRAGTDIDIICLKCLEKSPAKRYASARDLADDLRRALDNRPIEARPAGWGVRMGKWAARNKGGAGLVAASVLVIVVLVVALVVNNLMVRSERDRANRAVEAIKRFADNVGQQAIEASMTRRRSDALNFFTQAETLRRVLADTYPDEAAYRYDLAYALNHLAVWHFTDNDYAKALETFDGPRCLAAAEELVTAAPDNADSKRLLADILDNSGMTLTRQQAAAAAEQRHRRALSLRLDIVQRLQPNNPDAQLSYTRTLNHIGNALKAQNALDQAAASYKESLDIKRRLAAVNQGIPQLREEIAYNWVNLADIHLKKGKFALAREQFGYAKDRLQSLHEEDRENLEYRAALAVAWIGLGAVEWELEDGDPTTALAAFEKGLQEGEAVLKGQPQQPTARQILGVGRAGRAWALLALGRTEEGLAEAQRADKAAQASDLPGETYLLTARALALAAQAIADDKARSEPMRARAVALLNRAAASTDDLRHPERAQEVVEHRDFQTLRDRDDFRQLAAKLLPERR